MKSRVDRAVDRRHLPSPKTSDGFGFGCGRELITRRRVIKTAPPAGWSRILSLENGEWEHRSRNMELSVVYRAVRLGSAAQRVCRGHSGNDAEVAT